MGQGGSNGRETAQLLPCAAAVMTTLQSLIAPEASDGFSVDPAALAEVIIT